MQKISKENMMFCLVLLILVAVFGVSFMASGYDPSAQNLQGFATYQSVCHDTDGGVNSNFKGSVTTKDAYHRTIQIDDSCVYDQLTKKYYLEEQFCRYDMPRSKEVECEHGCYDGKCLKIETCYRDGEQDRNRQAKGEGLLSYKSYAVDQFGDEELLEPFCELNGDFIIPYCHVVEGEEPRVEFIRKKCDMCGTARNGQAFCGDT